MTEEIAKQWIESNRFSGYERLMVSDFINADCYNGPELEKYWKEITRQLEVLRKHWGNIKISDRRYFMTRVMMFHL